MLLPIPLDEQLKRLDTTPTPILWGQPISSLYTNDWFVVHDIANTTKNLEDVKLPSEKSIEVPTCI